MLTSKIKNSLVLYAIKNAYNANTRNNKSLVEYIHKAFLYINSSLKITIIQNELIVEKMVGGEGLEPPTAWV